MTHKENVWQDERDRMRKELRFPLLLNRALQLHLALANAHHVASPDARSLLVMEEMVGF